MSKRQPISNVIAAPSTPPALRSQLEAVASIREFATKQLALPDNGSYRSYADVGRPYVVWNVVAAPEFSVDPKEWCYPIVGCVAYRGYFVEAGPAGSQPSSASVGWTWSWAGRRRIRRWVISTIPYSIPWWAGTMWSWQPSCFMN
jgi:predicted aminopeptidase